MHIIHMSYHGPVLAVLNAALAGVAQERLRAIYPTERVWAEIAQGPELKGLEVAVVPEDLEIVQAHRMDWTEVDGQYRHKSVRETLRILMGRYVMGNARGRRTEGESWEAARDLVLESRKSGIYLTGLRSYTFSKRCLERVFGSIVGCEPKRTAFQTLVF